MTTSTSGPPRLYTISVIADTGPISSGPTSATAHSGRITAIIADTEAAHDDRHEQVGEIRDGAGQRRAVKHRRKHEHAAADDQPPRADVRRQPGGEHAAEGERDRERDEADAGLQRRVAQHVLHESPIITVSVSITPPARNSETNVITRLRLSNTENGTSGFSAVRSTSRNATKNTTAATPAPITHGSTQAARRPRVNTSTAARAAERGQQRAGDVELESLVVCLGRSDRRRSR